MKRFAIGLAVLAITLGMASPAVAKPKAVVKKAPATGFGTYTYSYEGSRGTLEIPTPSTDPAVGSVEVFRQAAGEPAVTYVVADVDNTKGADSVDMYQVAVVTKAGDQIEVGRIDTMVGTWNEALGTSNSELYNVGINLQNSNDTMLLPGAKGTNILGTNSVIGSVGRVFVYPNGGFDRVEARMVSTKVTPPKKGQLATVSEAGAAYLLNIAPFNTSEEIATARENAWTTATPSSQMVSDLAPRLAAYKTLDAFLSSYPWPTVVSADIMNLIQADRAVAADLSQIGTSVTLPSATWTAQYTQDGTASEAAVAAVRQALGLPAAAAS